MSLPFTTHQVYVLRPPKVLDGHGNKSRSTKDWPNAVRSGPFDACVQPDSASLGASLATSETRDGGREQTKRSIQVFLDPGVDVLATDGVEVEGAIWEINGSSFTLPDVGGLGHVIFKADLVRG
ncbi:hypothetical protein F4561_002669 [Lipingzhangella halophila]|uniref:Head-to-tail stopper n=1 Tax=Lipingzhangella halophila TaxID=1783352 RepID=A0A7W7RH39_9ACTN|nr:hypothetical protein [Lipingzhangella halophila]MBB4931849.1 hypothetical protein [Lipingzhangella halophila]